VRDNRGRQVLLHWGTLARGASTGFTVLFVGGWLYPAAHRLSPVVGTVFLVVVGAIGFGAAGARCGRVESAALHGAVAAFLGYALMVPVILTTNRDLLLSGLGWAITGALIVGGATAHLMGRRGSADEETSAGRQDAGRAAASADAKISGAKTPARIPPAVKGPSRGGKGSGGKGPGRSPSGAKRGARG
jgi:hypothetical protein